MDDRCLERGLDKECEWSVDGKGGREVLGGCVGGVDKVSCVGERDG